MKNNIKPLLMTFKEIKTTWPFRVMAEEKINRIHWAHIKLSGQCYHMWRGNKELKVQTKLTDCLVRGTSALESMGCANFNGNGYVTRIVMHFSHPHQFIWEKIAYHQLSLHGRAIENWTLKGKLWSFFWVKKKKKWGCQKADTRIRAWPRRKEGWMI